MLRRVKIAVMGVVIAAGCFALGERLPFLGNLYLHLIRRRGRWPSADPGKRRRRGAEKCPTLRHRRLQLLARIMCLSRAINLAVPRASSSARERPSYG